MTMGSMFRRAGSTLGTIGGHTLAHGLMVGMTAYQVAGDMRKAREEGRGPIIAGVHSAARNILPLLMTAHIKSISRQMFSWGLISNPAMVAGLAKGAVVGISRTYKSNLESSLPFSHTYQPTQQAYAHMQEGLAAMGNTNWAGSEAAVFSARYMNNRY